MKFNSIKTKVLFWFALSTIILLILFNAALYYFLEQNTKLSIQNKLYNKAVFINKNIINNVSVDKLFEDEELKQLDVAIIKENEVIYSKGKVNFNNYMEFINKNDSFYIFNQESSLDGMYILRVSNPFKGAILFYQYNVDEEITKEFSQIKQILIILEPVLFILLMLLASKLVNKILRSIKDITNTANEIYVNNFSKEIPTPKYDDEIKELVDSFNQMILRLKDGVEHLEQFNSDVSHELKTPLTVIKGEIEITLNKVRDVEYYEKSLRTIENEANSIQEIVDNLLLLTKYTKDNIEQTFDIVNLDSILLSSVDRFKNQLKSKNIKLNLVEFNSIQMNANPILIATIFSNLIDNAIKYSNDNTQINIYLYKEDSDSKIHFIIEDSGIGISSNHIDNITKRFYRVDPSRNKKVKGYGLGLSIVQNSVMLHGGDITISSEKNKGTQVEITL